MSTIRFKFIDNSANKVFLRLLKQSGLKHRVDKDGMAQYSATIEKEVENEVIGQVRSRIFDSWQVLSCPADWVSRYRNYMKRHDIAYVEEMLDDEIDFLIPKSYRPHTWKL